MEALERRGKMMAISAILFIVSLSQCQGVAGQRNNTKMSYVCAPDFVRLGHSCYYFSDTNATWQNALFACEHRDSNLTVPARWEDRHLRNYLNRPDLPKESRSSRWIGGIYDYSARSWKWGGELKTMHYQSFSRMKKMSPEELQWHCIAMMPELNYRWHPRKCLEPRKYICKTKLQKLPKSKVKDFKRRWQRMGTINEITVPSVSREVNNPMMVNDVTVNPVHNPKSYDLRPVNGPGRRYEPGMSNRTPKHRNRPKALRKRPNVLTHLKRPFPGYQWNRRDPEGSYQRNAELLRSGRTGLSRQQVNVHLARLQHLRDKQIARRNRLRDREDWLVNDVKPVLAQTHARTYMVDNNISALHPKTIVEEFDMMPPPQQVAVRATRGAG